MMSCQCHLFNNCSFCNNSSNNENELESFYSVFNVSPQPLLSFPEYFQDHLNGANNYDNDGQIEMEEVNISQIQNFSNNSFDHELDLFFKNIPELNDHEKKEINFENISETDNIVPLVEDTPKNYDNFVQEMKMTLKKLKDNKPEDNEYLICNINDELLSQNASLKDSSLFLDFDNTNNKKKKDNNEDIKTSQYKKDNYLKNFYEEKKPPSKDMNESLKLNCENASFPQREKNINYQIKGKSNCIFKTQIMQKSGEKIILMEKNENSLHLSLDKKSNKKEQKAKNDNKSEKNKGNIFLKIQNIESSNKNESEDYTKKIFDKENNSCLIGCKNKKETQCSQISKNTSSQTNISTSKESVSINILNFSKNNISTPLSENSLSNINFNNNTFSGFSHENNNYVSNIYELNRIFDNNLCNKKRKREKEEKIIDMKNNSCENISKTKNSENNNNKKTFDEQTNDMEKKRDKIKQEIYKYDNNLRRLYNIVKFIFGKFRKYLFDKNKIPDLGEEFNNKYFKDNISSYPHSFMKGFFSEDIIVELYKEFLADPDNKNYLKEKYVDDTYKICINNFHKLYSKKYSVNDLDFEKNS